jgi:hypothetical protein
MKTIEASAVISTLQQASEARPRDEIGIAEANSSGHPLGSVLFRLELVLALLSAGQRQASAVKVHSRT